MIYSVVYLCQLFVFVIHIRYLLFIRQLFVVHYYSFSYFVRCSIIHFVSFSFVLLIVVQKKKNNSDPELCSGISIP